MYDYNSIQLLCVCLNVHISVRFRPAYGGCGLSDAGPVHAADEAPPQGEGVHSPGQVQGLGAGGAPDGVRIHS